LTQFLEGICDSCNILPHGDKKNPSHKKQTKNVAMTDMLLHTNPNLCKHCPVHVSHSSMDLSSEAETSRGDLDCELSVTMETFLTEPNNPERVIIGEQNISSDLMTRLKCISQSLHTLSRHTPYLNRRI